MPWPHFDVVCDLLLNRQIATKNLFGNLITQGIYWGCFKHFFIYILLDKMGPSFIKKKVYLTLSCLFLFSLIRKGSLTSCEEELREVRSNHHKEWLLVIMLLKTFFNTIYKLLLDVFHSFIICFTAFWIVSIFFNSYNNVQRCMYMWCVYFANNLIFSAQSFKSSTMDNIFKFGGWMYWKGNIQHSNMYCFLNSTFLCKLLLTTTIFSFFGVLFLL